MAGFLVQVSWIDSNTGIPNSAFCGVPDGAFASAVQALNAAKTMVVAYRTAKGEVPVSVTVTLAATR